MFTRRHEPTKLHQINPPLAALDLCDPTMRHLKASRQFALRKAGAFAGGSQLGAQKRIFGRMGRFFHWPDYRSRLECSQIRSSGVFKMKMTCARCGSVKAWNDDWFGFLCPTCADEMDSVDRGESLVKPRQFRLTIPTYNANYFDKVTHEILMEEFSEPNVPVLVHEAAGVRVVLGTHDYDEMEKPDIQIERRAHGWAIFLHPEGGGDPSGYVYFLDDGRSYLVREHHGSTPAIQLISSVDELEELDSREAPVSRSNEVLLNDNPIIQVDQKPQKTG